MQLILMGELQIDSHTSEDVLYRPVCLLLAPLSLLLCLSVFISFMILQLASAFLCLSCLFLSVYSLARSLSMSVTHAYSHTHLHRNSHYLISRGSSHLAL